MMKTIRWAVSLLLVSVALCGCDNESVPGKEDVDPTDTLWYEVRDVATFTVGELVDSLCSVEPVARDYVGMLTMLVNKNIRVNVINYLYESSNGKGQKARLSAQLLVPTLNGKLVKEGLVLDNRATQIADADVPTNKLNIGTVLCLSGTPVVTADLLGYGSTVNLSLSYNCHHTAAVNTVDAALVAQQMLHSSWLGLDLLPDPLPLYNEGYSQGGYDALAVQRYLENEASPRVRKQLPLVRTKCGAGPYDQRAFLEAVLQWEDYSYSPYVVTSVISFLNYHSDLFPSEFHVEYVLSEKIRNSNLVEMINSKQYGDRAIKKYVVDVLDGDVSMSNIFSQELICPDGEWHDICLQVAEHESVLRGWTPVAPVDFFHATNDDCVPVECMYAAQKAFAGCPNVTFEEVDTPAASGLHSLSYVRFITNILLGGWN